MGAELREIPAYARLPLQVVGAEGCELVLADGRRVLDLYGGHCVNALGAGDPGLGAVLARQWRELSFQTNLLDFPGRAAFAAAFGASLPITDGGWSFFLSNSGAEANENAVKLALHATRRERVVAFTGAFHGRTAAAAALSDKPEPAFPRAPFDVVRVPWNDTAAARQAIDARTAAVVLEPIQSLAGVRDPAPGFLEALRAACDASGAALVYDEVQTGSGRLGAPWAAQAYGVVPDVLTTAKAAASGFPIGITVARTRWAERVPGHLFGSTFGGGPLALAAATEVARRVSAPGFLEHVRAASRAFAAAAVTGPVQAVRGRGLLLGLVLEAGLSAKDARDQLLARGVLVGTSDDPRVLRLSPPLTIDPARAADLGNALADLAVSATPSNLAASATPSNRGGRA